MSQLDKAKEYIGVIKVYMGFLLASMIATVTGTVKLYLSEDINPMFWIGVVGIILLSTAFLFLMIHLHKKVNELENL